MKFLISLFLVFSLYAEVIDRIAIVVNDIPITSYDIIKTAQKLNTDKTQAINYLVDQSVLKSAIKKRGIYVDEFDIDNAMKKIALQNGMGLFDFKTYLLQKGELSKLQKQLKHKLELEKLFQSLNIKISQEEIKKYYDTHKDEFKLPSKIEVTEYASNNRDDLQQIIQNPMIQNQNVTMRDIVLDSNKTNPKLLQFLASQEVNNFTPIVNMGDKLVTFYIKKKFDYTDLDFKIASMEIYKKLLQKRKDNAIKDFVAKLKAKANIEILDK